MSGYCHNMSSVVCLSVTQVYCDKTAEVKIIQFSLKCNPMLNALTLCLPSLMTKFKGDPSIGGSKKLQLEWGGFRLRDAVYRKRCEIELRWKLITDRKSYMGSWLQQKSMTLNDLERQFTAVSSILCVLWKNRLRLELRGFRYKVALLHLFLFWIVLCVLILCNKDDDDDDDYTSSICMLSLTTKLKWISSNFKHNFWVTCVQS